MIGKSSLPTFSFGITTCPSDIHYARILVSSLNFFHPEIPITIVADGGVSTRGLQKVPSVHRIYRSCEIPAVKKYKLNGLLTKLAFFWLDEFEYNILLDADSVVIRPFVDLVKKHIPFDFMPLHGWEVDLSDHYGRELVAHYCFSPELLHQYDPQIDLSHLIFFVSGHWCLRPSEGRREEILRHREYLTTRHSRDTLFYFGDQGLLNYLINRHRQQNTARIAILPITLLGHEHVSSGIDLSLNGMLHGSESPWKIIHFTGPSRRSKLSTHPYGSLLTYFNTRYYAQQPPGMEIFDHLKTFPKKILTRIKKSRLGAWLNKT